MSDSRSPISDEEHMRLAIELAANGEGWVEPNPMVGCVLVRDGIVIGKGYHEKFGGPHAEVNAIRSVADPSLLDSATAYVTLEPCCHTGKTPPCCDALIEAGIARVVTAMRDPFPKVDGGGLDRLERAGIETVVGVLQHEAEALNAPYRMRLRESRPWVIGKWAMSVDGKIATATGESQWITNEASRRDVHRLRSRVDAIITGMGTVQSDDPELTARNVDQLPRLATRVVMCRKSVPSGDSKLVKTIGSVPLLIAAGPGVDEQALTSLERTGADVLRCSDEDPKSMVAAVLADLSQREMTNVMLEGGGAILGSFADASMIDEYHIYLGPSVIGGRAALGPLGGTGIERLSDAAKLRLRTIDRLGDDVKLIYARASSEASDNHQPASGSSIQEHQ